MRYNQIDRPFRYLIVTILVLSTLCHAEEVRPKQCDTTDLGIPQCGKNERCRLSHNNQQSICECQLNFHLVNGECVKMPDLVPMGTIIATSKPLIQAESGGGSVAAGLLIPTFIVVIGALLYFGARRFKWLQRFRQYRHNRYGNVLVTRGDDDDDDPPIS